MKFGVCLMHYGRETGRAELVEAVTETEQLGFDSIHAAGMGFPVSPRLVLAGHYDQGCRGGSEPAPCPVPADRAAGYRCNISREFRSVQERTSAAFSCSSTTVSALLRGPSPPQ